MRRQIKEQNRLAWEETTKFECAQMDKYGHEMAQEYAIARKMTVMAQTVKKEEEREDKFHISIGNLDTSQSQEKVHDPGLDDFEPRDVTVLDRIKENYLSDLKQRLQNARTSDHGKVERATASTLSQLKRNNQAVKAFQAKTTYELATTGGLQRASISPKKPIHRQMQGPCKIAEDGKLH